MATVLNKARLDNLAGEIWKSAERLRGKFKGYEYQGVILPIIVIRRLECVLLEWREAKRAEVLAIVTEPYEKTFTAANVTKELEFHASELTFRARVKSSGGPTSVSAADATPLRQGFAGQAERVPPTEDRVIELVLKPGDNAARKFKDAFGKAEGILAPEWTHRHYVQDDEYIPHGEDIEAFLEREIAKPIIRWEDSPQLGYEILPNKYFYRYQPPTPAKELLAEFWKLEKEAEKMLEGLGQ